VVSKWTLLFVAWVIAACSTSNGDSQFSDAATRRDAATQPDAAADASRTVDSAVSGDDAGEGVVDGEASCTAGALDEPRVQTRYYVAIEQPGADNERCDGLASTDEGGGHCPFKDFSSPRTRGLLDGVKARRVDVRQGTYVMTGWDGLQVRGMGADLSEQVVLSAFAGEHPVFDVASPDGAACTTPDAPTTAACVRQVIRIAGQYTSVQGLTVHNGLGYHVEVNGGAHHVVRCNTFGETVAFAMRSDCLKLDGGATDLRVLHNDFSRFRSQAIDMTNVRDVLVEDNDFYDPVDADAGAVGVKFGARNVTIRGNRVHDLGASPRLHAFSLGGTGSAHPDDHAAYAVSLESNRVWNIAGLMAQLVSCDGCTVRDNDLSFAGGGILVSASATGQPECSATAAGCGPNRAARITGNRMRDLDGGGDPKQANVFIFVEAGESQEFFAGENLYCTPASQVAHFSLGGALLDFAAWSSGSGTDTTSTATDVSDSRCSAF
jgi:hypothetical protein